MEIFKIEHKFILTQAEPADAEQIATKCDILATLDNPLRRVMYPKDDVRSEAELHVHTANLRKTLSDPEIPAWKPCTQDGRIVGFACWSINNGFFRPGKGRTSSNSLELPQTLDVEAWISVSQKLAAEKRRVLQGYDRVLRLQTISVAPEYQCQGIGAMLMRASLDIADELRLKSFVMASPAAVKLYLNAGYEVVGQVVVGDAVFRSMLRERSQVKKSGDVAKEPRAN